MKIAGSLTSMDAKRTYTEVNSFSLGLQTNTQASPTQPDYFTARFKSLIGSSPSLPISNQQEGSIDQATKKSPRASPESPHLQALVGEIIGQPTRLLTTIHETPETEEKTNLTPTQATITSRFVHYEQEEVFFSSSGMVATEDGREISFSLDLSMQRTTTETLEMSMAGGSLARYLLDPLILNFNGGPATFSDTSFFFDLDCDGMKDNLAALQPGCGFLAFDLNEDGIINDGMELFGPQSGNGFTDLAKYDTDSNLWIDENDPVFDSLSIWHPNEQGEESLLSLKEAGVGAISLSHAGTEFTIQGTAGEVIAQVTASGIFLTEEGEVRSLQEVELALDTAETKQEDTRDNPSPLNDILEAMTNLRIIIAMQRVRARVMMARERLESPFQPFLSATSLWEQLQQNFFPAETITTDTNNKEPPESTDKGQQNDSIIQPLLTIHEMRDYSRQRTTHWRKNHHYHEV
jgi:hypothetical protein